MKIRRKSEKPTVSVVDGVPPFHTLLTCTYQKLFKRDAGFMLVGGAPQDNGLAPLPATTPHAGHGHGTSDHKPHRHERGSSSSWRVGREGEEKQTTRFQGGAHEGGASRGHEDSSPTQDLPNPHAPPSKRRKVKSTRYAEFAEKFSDEIVAATPKPEKRSRNTTVEDALGNNAKEALIASIFYVFDTLGKEGLTASEVVAIMLEQSLPGLKEGGARHTVQVANVLRRSKHFLTMGNKQYLPCTVTPEPSEPRRGKNGKLGSTSCKQGRMPVCKLYDGSGWFCPRDAQAGLSLCTHHLDMINRGKIMQGSTSTATTVTVASKPSQQQQQQSAQDVHQESDSDQTDSEDIGPALAKWGRDRTPGSVPNQKRKMLSLCSIK